MPPSGRDGDAEIPTALDDAEDRGFKTVADRLRGTRGPVLLEGETGTGKTKTAERLHHTEFGRTGSHFRAVNCGALDRDYARLSTFFRGVRQGVYTGVGRSKSVFEDVDGGTILLDEFQELEQQHQATLLDLLSPFTTSVSGYAAGSNAQRWTADVQVVLAINRPLRELLATGALRSDLNFRVWRRARLPTVREFLSAGDATRFLRNKLLRMQEVWALAAVRREGIEEAFRKTFRLVYDEANSLIAPPSPPAVDAMPIPEELVSHHWTGNYRELEGVAQMLLRDGGLGAWSEAEARAALELVRPPHETTAPGAEPPPKKATPSRAIAEAWLSAFETPGRSVQRIARELGLDARTARKRVEKLAAGLATPSRDLWFVAQFSDEERRRLHSAAAAIAADF